MRSVVTLCALAAALAIGVLRGGVATAQPTVALGRAEFDAGLSAWRAGQAVDARTHFERAYALLPQPLVLLNLAGAYAATDRLIDAAESYRRFLRQADTGPAAAFRDAAVRALDEVVRRTPRARLAVRGLAPDDRVRLDGATLVRAALFAELPVDPGVHELSVARGPAGTVVARARFELAAEAQTVVALVVPPPARTAVIAPARADRVPRGARAHSSAGRSVASSPWFWLAAGTLLAAGTGVGLYVAGVFGDSGAGNVPPSTVVVP